jgi:ABC-type branched-subunit amino acid transport system substrate-binding protein
VFGASSYDCGTATDGSEEATDAQPGGVSRRDVLRTMAAVGAVLATAPGVLAACSGDDRSDNAVHGAGTTGSPSGGAGRDAGARLAEVLQIDPATSGRGMDVKVGAVLALSGTGSFYGKTMSRGIDLAVQHIKAAGGPNFSITYYDHKSGDAVAGGQAVTELGSAGYPAKLASYADDLGAMLGGTEQYKIFTLDGGGGAPVYAQNKAYFWGTRAITPDDVLPGLFMWLHATQPDKTTVGLTGWDVGEPNNSVLRTGILAKVAEAGYRHNGLYELFPIGTQDFSAVFPKLKANEPDILLFGAYGQDPGAFVNQSRTAGLTSMVIGFEFTPDGLNASKGAYDDLGWTFAYDYFDAEQPTNPLAKLFVDEFERAYGDRPDFYAANYYEDTLNLWALIRRIIKGGGSTFDGPALDAALRSDLTLAGVYGGGADTLGTYALDPATHSVIQRPMGVFEYKNGKVTAKAFFDIGAAGYRPA